MNSASNWRGARRTRLLRRSRSGDLLGPIPARRSRLRVAVEAFYWLAIIGLALYAIFAPVLPEGGPL